MISMSGAWDKEKLWAPDRIRTYDLPNTGPTLYPLELRRSHGERGHTAISRKVVGRSARDNPERYCGWFWVHCSSKKFERMAREAMDVCLRVLKESNKSRFDSYSVRNSVLIISHITFRDCRVHIFSDNLSRNSCILGSYLTRVLHTAGISNVDVSLCAEWMKDCKSFFFFLNNRLPKLYNETKYKFVPWIFVDFNFDLIWFSEDSKFAYKITDFTDFT